MQCKACCLPSIADVIAMTASGCKRQRRIIRKRRITAQRRSSSSNRRRRSMSLLDSGAVINVCWGFGTVWTTVGHTVLPSAAILSGNKSPTMPTITLGSDGRIRQREQILRSNKKVDGDGSICKPNTADERKTMRDNFNVKCSDNHLYENWVPSNVYVCPAETCNFLAFRYVRQNGSNKLRGSIYFSHLVEAATIQSEPLA